MDIQEAIECLKKHDIEITENDKGGYDLVNFYGVSLNNYSEKAIVEYAKVVKPPPEIVGTDLFE